MNAHPTSPAARLTLLGGFQLRDAAGTERIVAAKKAKALLAYLALQPGQAQTREKLAALLWGEGSDEQARQSLRQALAGLRKALPANVIGAVDDQLWIDAARLSCDVNEFRRLGEAGSSENLVRALDLYQGELLEGLNPRAEVFEEWLLSERAQLQHQALVLMERLLTRHLEDEHPGQALDLALRLLSLDPLREATHRVIMQLHARRGHFTAALKQYDQCRRLLQRELGVAPEAETEQLQQQILARRRRPGDAAQDEAPPPAPTTAARAQLRQATVLCLRLEGFATWAETLGAEALHRHLSRYYALVDAEVGRRGGNVVKRLDDLVMVLFGVPLTHDDDSWRALQAAVALRRAVGAAFRREGLTAQLGLASGQLLAGDLGSPQFQEYGVVGSPLSSAERLARAAAGGQVLVSEACYRQHAQQLEARPLTSVQGWQIHALHPQAIHRPGFIGRQREMRLLSAALQECRSNERGEAFYVRGAAGIGKSRLMEAWVERACAQGFEAQVMQCRDVGDSAPSVIQTLVQGLVGRLAQGQVEALVKRGVIESGQRPLLHDLLGQAPDAASMFAAMEDAARQQGRQAVLTRLLQAAAAQRPLLLLVEDIHWADADTLSHLAALVQSASRLPLLLAMTSRVAGEPLDPAWRGAMLGASLTTLDLGVLAPEEMQALARTQEADSGLAQRCIERAAGNPFFLLQLLQGVGDTDARLPDSIQVLVQAQLDRLAARDRQAAQAAAVLGQHSPLAALRHLLADDAYDGAALAQAGMLRPQGEVLIFHHALIQESVYTSMLGREAAALHQRAAQWYAQRDAVLHAEHLDRADHPAAAAALLAAARRLAAQYRLPHARQLLRRGLSRTGDDGFELALLLGELSRETGHIDAAIAAFARAEAAAQHPLQRCRALMGRAACLHLHDEYQAALTTLAQAEALTRRQDAVAERARIAYLRGNVLFPLGRLDECMASHQQALDGARQCGSLALEAHALSGLADAHYLRGRMQTAHELFRRCVDLARQHDLKQIEVNNLSMRGLTAMYLNRLEQGMEDNRRCIELAQQIGNRRAELSAREILGMMLYFQGALAAAQDQLERGLALAQQLGARRFEADCFGVLADIAAAQGRPDHALRLIQRALRLSGDDLAYMGAWFLGQMARYTPDGDKRRWALAEAQRILSAGAVGHNHIHFYENAIYSCIQQQDWDQAGRYAEALGHYTAAEPLPWAELIMTLGRLAASRGHADAQAFSVDALAERYHRHGIHHVDAVLAGLAQEMETDPG
ncbi:hypothetical protein Tel_14670 [Candidatus Tenderia electrophaga]|jgi:DNA-binding SARP family transcriptional activator/predicted ATPase|uniref:Guanylate cyclase domain-containing protein n=1 Tax=Candidatus Tenderia electrophaga TaxID=1748243 RepID=A0A0S2TGM0_9GAMM|nr:hypothetical protein Tel_14670 [Candidatus Tenderia electrophaga]